MDLQVTSNAAAEAVLNVPTTAATGTTASATANAAASAAVNPIGQATANATAHSAANAAAGIGSNSVSFADAQACTSFPNLTNSVEDEQYRLWGFDEVGVLRGCAINARLTKPLHRGLTRQRQHHVHALPHPNTGDPAILRVQGF